MTRRDLLFHTASGLGGIALSGMLAEDRGLAATPGDNADPMRVRQPHFAAKAKSVIFLFMDGGVSHVDTFDPKPKLSAMDGKPLPFDDDKVNARNDVKILWGSPFEFTRRGQCGAEVSSLFPHLGGCVDDMAIIRSMHADQTEHTAGNYQMHSGFAIQGRPSMGAWIAYGLGSSCKNLPGFVVIDTGMIPPGGLDLFGAGFLPASYQGMLFRKGAHPVADIAPREPSPELQRNKIDFIRKLDQGVARRYGPVSEIEAAIFNYELAFRMQSEVPDLLDFSRESKATLSLYGIGQQDTDEFGRACLIARRMVERGVRFIELLSPRRPGADRWDQHGSLVKGHGMNCKATDQPIAALIRDLKSRGMLDETLLVWGGEFGRTPTRQGSEDRGWGRDHHPFGFTMWMAGGGAKGGYVHGATDEFGYFATEKKVHVHDLHATILHLLGLDHKRLTYPFGGRQMRLTDVHGNVVRDLLA